MGLLQKTETVSSIQDENKSVLNKNQVTSNQCEQKISTYVIHLLLWGHLGNMILLFLDLYVKYLFWRLELFNVLLLNIYGVSLRTKLVEVMEFQLSYFKSWKMMLWKCCTQHASKCGKQQWPQDWKRSVFIPIPKKGNAKECSNYRTITLISHASKVMLKIFQARL